MVQHFLFSNILIYTILTLLIGTLLSYVVYFFSYRNSMQNINTGDGIYNTIKTMLLVTLSTSFIFFLYFLYAFYVYFLQVNNFYVFTKYSILPKIQNSLVFNFFEFSVDLFGIFLLFLAYFVGVLSLLALDNRLF